MIDFWTSVGSTYSYLTVMRLKSVEQAEGVRFRWRPFSIRAIMIEQNNIPFRDKPIKAAYMWRDIGRRAQMYGLAPKLPAPYPLREWDVANRVAIVGEAEGWLPDYMVATYRRWFDGGDPAGSEPNLSESLNEIGQDPQRVLATAASEETERRYLAATEEAKGLGIFGVPTFVVGGELFWGDDRLNDAINWLRHGRVAG
jgi:2-hydroxychromene-2-carboxylate isomerase